MFSHVCGEALHSVRDQQAQGKLLCGWANSPPSKLRYGVGLVQVGTAGPSLPRCSQVNPLKETNSSVHLTEHQKITALSPAGQLLGSIFAQCQICLVVVSVSQSEMHPIRNRYGRKWPIALPQVPAFPHHRAPPPHPSEHRSHRYHPPDLLPGCPWLPPVDVRLADPRLPLIRLGHKPLQVRPFIQIVLIEPGQEWGPIAVGYQPVLRRRPPQGL